MPRAALPPTPASSTDILGKDGTKQLSSLQMAFELPPAAMHEANQAAAAAAGSEQQHARGTKRNTPESPVSQASPKAPYPIQPSEAVKARRRSSAAANRENASFALPPPPTRSRKIIQMKPRTQQQQEDKKPAAAEPTPTPTPTASGKSTGRKAVSAAATAAAAASAAGDVGPSKRKQPSATSAAGRKIARKTAHSLIERRRRSKMNEEFAVLKGMIPACTGEMHKLAILQASIEYVRYLQDCVEKLQLQRETGTATEMTGISEREAYKPAQAFQTRLRSSYEEEEGDEDGDSQDVEMTGSDIAPSPTFTTRPSSSTASQHQPSTSPALATQDVSSSSSLRRSDSYASISTPTPAAAEHHRHYSFHSATTSPAVGPGWAMGAGYAPSNHSAAGSTLTSPALGPLMERDLDQEATAALLMLNSDRRGTVSSASGGGTNAGGRGMSVRDLLSA